MPEPSKSSLRVIEGDCVEAMAALPMQSVDAIVCDPPYGIRFMGHAWDAPGVATAAVPGDNRRPGRRERTASMHAGEYDLRPAANRQFQEWTEAWAREAWRALKPGGHLLAFAGTRTYHRMVSGVEDAGFEVRDQIAWLFGSGFPKSLNLNGDWQGWGTALKPAHEPIVVARKPLAKTVAANVLAHGTGVLNVDGCRIGVADGAYACNHSGDRGHAGTRSIEDRGATDLCPGGGSAATGRWPANVVMDEEAAAMLDAQTAHLHAAGNVQPSERRTGMGFGGGTPGATLRPIHDGSSGGASRFFYCAKADAAERNAGLGGDGGLFADPDAPDRNDHPTVKPISLMRWLVRLVTPPGGTVLDPFCGSGTTGCAAALEGFDFIGIEREPAYARIARARLAHWSLGAVA